MHTISTTYARLSSPATVRGRLGTDLRRKSERYEFTTFREPFSCYHNLTEARLVMNGCV